MEELREKKLLTYWQIKKQPEDWKNWVKNLLIYWQTATLEEEWVNRQLMNGRIERKKLLTYRQIKNSQRIGRIW